jgi:hypothetical protein
MPSGPQGQKLPADTAAGAGAAVRAKNLSQEERSAIAKKAAAGRGE